MKSRLFKLTLFLILGALVNIAVAWGCAQGGYKVPLEQRLAAEGDSRWWDAHVPKEASGSPAYYIVDTIAFGVSRTLMEARDMPQPDTIQNHANRLQAGLPMRTLEGSRWFFTENGQSRLIERHFMGVFNDRIIVPMCPIWSGFAINTVFYAVLLWILALVPYTARRSFRRKRGRCIMCGYDLRGDFDSGCSECGWGRRGENSEQIDGDK